MTRHYSCQTFTNNSDGRILWRDPKSTVVPWPAADKNGGTLNMNGEWLPWCEGKPEIKSKAFWFQYKWQEPWFYLYQRFIGDTKYVYVVEYRQVEISVGQELLSEGGVNINIAVANRPGRPDEPLVTIQVVP